MEGVGNNLAPENISHQIEVLPVYRAMMLHIHKQLAFSMRLFHCSVPAMCPTSAFHYLKKLGDTRYYRIWVGNNRALPRHHNLMLHLSSFQNQLSL